MLQGKPERSRRRFRIAGSLTIAALVLLSAACARRGEVTLPPDASDRLDDARQVLMEKFLIEGIPSASDPVYSRRGIVSPASIRLVRQDLSFHGPVSSVRAEPCSVHSRTVLCEAKFVSEAGPGTAFVIWAKEDRTWKVAFFRVSYDGEKITILRNASDGD